MKFFYRDHLIEQISLGPKLEENISDSAKSEINKAFEDLTNESKRVIADFRSDGCDERDVCIDIYFCNYGFFPKVPHYFPGPYHLVLDMEAGHIKLDIFSMNKDHHISLKSNDKISREKIRISWMLMQQFASSGGKEMDTILDSERRKFHETICMFLSNSFGKKINFGSDSIKRISTAILISYPHRENPFNTETRWSAFWGGMRELKLK